MAYSSVCIVGDSLVDSGNALRLANFYETITLGIDDVENAPIPENGYFQGRFSNGYVFADLICNKAIGLVSKPVFPFGYEDPFLGVPLAPFASDPSGNNNNFAYGGAHIIPGDELVSPFTDQTSAVEDAVDGHASPSALLLSSFGGNDIRDLAPAGSDPVPQDEAYAWLQVVATEYRDELGEMIAMGFRNIVITGIPDCGAIPAYDRDGDGVLNATEQVRADAATDYSIHLDMLMRTQVMPWLQQRMTAAGGDPDAIFYVPIMDYVDGSGETVTGALNASLPTLAALHGLDPAAVAADLLAYNELVWFDHVHPNAQANALFGSFMQAQISGTPWVETMPLLGADVDYRAVASIGAAGEVDGVVVSMVAGTSYTFQMIGVSTVTPFVLDQLDVASLGSGMVLADPALRLLSSGGTVLQTDDDSGVGLDALLSFSAATAGNYTLQMSGVGMLTGSYVLTATVSGAAMEVGNSYTVSNASTLVLEGAGGIGQDVVRTSVSYALAAGSEIEVLRTTNDRGKGAINLTGNEFDQLIVGNSGANVLEGRGGADVLTGGAGNDRFVLSIDALTSPGNVDAITDYGKGDVVDVTQILSLAAGTDAVGGGFLRVTKSGLVQVDLDGGGDEWMTLSTINGNSAVNVRYLADGTATTVSVVRVQEVSALGAAHGIEGFMIDGLGRHQVQHHDDYFM